MNQSKLESLIESWVNIIIGFSINFYANLLILPWFGFNVTASKAFGIGVIFTAISLARSYGIRRLFNKYGSGGWIGLWKTLTSKLREQLDLRHVELLTHRLAKRFTKKKEENGEATTISNATEQGLS